MKTISKKLIALLCMIAGIVVLTSATLVRIDANDLIGAWGFETAETKP